MCIYIYIYIYIHIRGSPARSDFKANAMFFKAN